MVRIVLALVLVACVEPKSSGGSHRQVIDIPAGPTTSLDLLFVIDDSPAIAKYAVSVASLGYELERAFRSAQGGMLDLQVAAITTTGGGVLRSTSTIDGPFAIDTHAPDGTRTENFDDSLNYAVTQLVSAGATSTEVSQPFAAARHMLEAPPPGFLRGSLAVVIVTARDDASPIAPEDFATFLRGLRPHPFGVVVIDISLGPPRLTQLTDLFGLFVNRSAHIDLASGDFGHAFDLLNQLLNIDLGDPCIAAPDADPTTDGPQYDCAFRAVREDGTETTLVPCNSGRAGGCWKLAPDPICVAPTTLRLFVRGFAETSRPHVRGSCITR